VLLFKDHSDGDRLAIVRCHQPLLGLAVRQLLALVERVNHEDAARRGERMGERAPLVDGLSADVHFGREGLGSSWPAKPQRMAAISRSPAPFSRVMLAVRIGVETTTSSAPHLMTRGWEKARTTCHDAYWMNLPQMTFPSIRSTGHAGR
jgi:hypothetical protein